MPYDPSGSGMWFEWRTGADGRRFRDFTHDRNGKPQVDDRFELDAAGNPVQVRHKISGTGDALDS